MPTFDTPHPVGTTIDIESGSIRVDASDRADTVVEVRPSDPGSSADVEAAEQTRIDYANGTLVVKAPKSAGRSFFGSSPSIDVAVDLPSDSALNANSASANQDYTGQLGAVRVNAASGDIRLARTGQLAANTASGDITIGHVAGHADINTASGGIRLTEVDGTAVVKTASGASNVGTVTGDLQLSSASGEVNADAPQASVSVKTASGNVRLGQVVRGSIACEAASGGVEIGIRSGTAAWLEVSSLSGTVRNSLDASEGPAETDDTVEVRTRTLSGDILIRRA